MKGEKKKDDQTVIKPPKKRRKKSEPQLMDQRKVGLPWQEGHREAKKGRSIGTPRQKANAVGGEWHRKRKGDCQEEKLEKGLNPVKGLVKGKKHYRRGKKQRKTNLTSFKGSTGKLIVKRPKVKPKKTEVLYRGEKRGKGTPIKKGPPRLP